MCVEFFLFSFLWICVIEEYLFFITETSRQFFYKIHETEILL